MQSTGLSPGNEKLMIMFILVFEKGWCGPLRIHPNYIDMLSHSFAGTSFS